MAPYNQHFPRRDRHAQSSVETLMVVPLFVMVFMSMYYLWSVCFAAQNAHIRAREYVLHGTAYNTSPYQTTGTTVFDGDNYLKAYGLGSRSATSSDASIPGMASYGSQTVTVTAGVGTSFTSSGAFGAGSSAADYADAVFDNFGNGNFNSDSLPELGLGGGP
jgi:hypothetical protein